MSAIPMALLAQSQTTATAGSAAAGKVPAGVFGLALQEALGVPGEEKSATGPILLQEQGSEPDGEAASFPADSEAAPGLERELAVVLSMAFAVTPAAASAAATGTAADTTRLALPATQNGSAPSANQGQTPLETVASEVPVATAVALENPPTLPDAASAGQGQVPIAAPQSTSPWVQPPTSVSPAAEVTAAPLPATPTAAEPVPVVSAPAAMAQATAPATAVGAAPAAAVRPVPATPAGPAPAAAAGPSSGLLPSAVSAAGPVTEALTPSTASMSDSLPSHPVPVGTGQPGLAAQVPTAAPQQPLPAALPLHTQMARPVFSLAQAGPGEHTMTLKVSPEDLGPVTVRAHIGSDNSVRVELFAASDAGREALKTVMAELRRDLAASGLNANLDLSAKNHPADTGAGQSRHEQETSGSAGIRSGSARSQTEELPAGSHSMFINGSSLDVMA